MATKDLLDLIVEIGHVGEVARALSAFERRRTISLGPVELVELANQTAGTTYRYPNPETAIELALAIGLLRSDGNFLSLTEAGVQFLKVGEAQIDLSLAQCSLIFGLFLDDPNVVLRINSLFQHFGRGIGGNIEAKDVAATWSTSDQHTSRFLQQLRVLNDEDGGLKLDPAFEYLLPTSSVDVTGLTEEALWKRLDAQRIRARRAEELVVLEEKKRLVHLGRRDLASLVFRISAENVSAGYDINSFETDESPRLIEVKSSVGKAIRFEWSLREHNLASDRRDAYWIYFVPFSTVLVNRTVPIWILRDPISLIQSGRLIEVPSSFTVSTLVAVSVTTPNSKAALRSPLLEWPERE